MVNTLEPVIIGYVIAVVLILIATLAIDFVRESRVRNLFLATEFKFKNIKAAQEILSSPESPPAVKDEFQQTLRNAVAEVLRYPFPLDFYLEQTSYGSEILDTMKIAARMKREMDQESKRKNESETRT